MSKYFPEIPGIQDVNKCVKVLKEAVEIGLGRRGLKNTDGRFLDKWVTYRELEDFILNSGIIAAALEYSITVTFGLMDPVDKTLASNILTVEGSGMVTISSETGSTDQLDQVAGLTKGQRIYILAAAGHTITIPNTTYIKTPYPSTASWTLTGYRIATLECVGGGICVMRTHEANRTS